jgi:hypothetical protein
LKTCHVEDVFWKTRTPILKSSANIFDRQLAKKKERKKKKSFLTRHSCFHSKQKWKHIWGHFLISQLLRFFTPTKNKIC